MAAPGLALVGFMQRDAGIHYLSNECVPANSDPAAVEADWLAAVGRLAPPNANVGQPNIQDLPPPQQAYVQQLKSAQDWQGVFVANPHWEIKLVEVAPLLAYQFSILDGAASMHGGQLGLAPSLDDLLRTCLPLTATPEGFTMTQMGNAALIQSRSLNLRPLNFWSPQPGILALQFGGALPFVHVVRFNGRCYLHNGYHRAFAALTAGATDIPCVFRDVANEHEIGLGPGTFGLALLESANPPTLHHYASGQAHPVDLVIKTRSIHISWTDWVTPEI